MTSPIIQTLAVIGFILSAYALYLERQKAKNSEFKAVCDISDNMSCTKAFSSSYGKNLGLSNSIYGLIFYTIIYFLDIFSLNNFTFYLAIISVIGSIYLAYILYTKVKSYCLICNGIYLVNILLLIFSYLNL
tara:strand:+ start:6995 stop:7390 length:396 start_codon:yes stop_codon:yes gene_type:complete